MPKDIFPQTTPEIAARHRQLAPDIREAFTSFGERIFAAAPPINIKQLIADAAARVIHYDVLHNGAVVLRDYFTDQQLRRRTLWGAPRKSVILIATRSQVRLILAARRAAGPGHSSVRHDLEPAGHSRARSVDGTHGAHRVGVAVALQADHLLWQRRA
jgi:hypothetical protein